MLPLISPRTTSFHPNMTLGDLDAELSSSALRNRGKSGECCRTEQAPLPAEQLGGFQ